MRTIRTTSTCEEVIKKSRFIAVILPSKSENDAKNHLHSLYQQHANASHIAYAYRILTPTGILCRFHDAGEPTGTAGKPIFHHLEGKQLINLTIAVIRYYGGIKLGAGGLTRAYGNSARQVIKKSDLSPYIQFKEISVILDYKQLQGFEYLLSKLNGKIIQQHFDTQIHLRISLPDSNSQQLISSYPAAHKSPPSSSG
jgi:uncharacterized YigZ family protein